MRKRPTSLRAGALLLALLLAVIIAVMTAGLLLLLQYHRQYGAHTLRQERLQRNLASGISLLLTDMDDMATQPTSISLYADGQDSVILAKHPWGIYTVGTVHATLQQDTASRWFLYGTLPDKTERHALFLTDEQRPLSISGHTRIRGDAYLPEAGIRKAYIENQAYDGEAVVYEGQTYTSTPSLAELNSITINRIAAYLYPDQDHATEIMDNHEQAAFGPDSVYRAFSDSPLLLLHPDSLVIDAHVLKGHIILMAEGPVTIKPMAQLEDILLFAPSITVADGFTGRLQLFARDSIVVGTTCVFDYPSVLGLVNRPADTLFSEFQPLIRIDSASTVNGVVFSHFQGNQQLLANVRLGKETTVNGQVHADGLLELRGTVKGITSCRRFTLQTPSSLYENFVLNGVMDLTQLSPHYVGTPLLNKGRHGSVIKWMDTNPMKQLPK